MTFPLFSQTWFLAPYLFLHFLYKIIQIFLFFTLHTCPFLSHFLLMRKERRFIPPFACSWCIWRVKSASPLHNCGSYSSTQSFSPSRRHINVFCLSPQLWSKIESCLTLGYCSTKKIRDSGNRKTITSSPACKLHLTEMEFQKGMWKNYFKIHHAWINSNYANSSKPVFSHHSLYYYRILYLLSFPLSQVLSIGNSL